jgi:aspartyl-tRNA(Asn)/glutamyl-tRNA(Gln) amidotransferase subunit A
MTEPQPDTDICYTSVTDLAQHIRSSGLSPTDVIGAYLKRITERDDEINAYITVTDELARKTAAEAEGRLELNEKLGPLHGVPIALKDLRVMKEGVTHTFGCAPFADQPAPRTSVVVGRLEAAGAVILGKTNTPEFGHKTFTDNEFVGPTATPFDTSKNAGGSSGGSAAAVAAGMAAAATGSDAGGSLRVPAALCGVYTLKPSFGLIPLDGRPNAFGKKLTHSVLGPITRTVADAALLMDVMAGPHPSDPDSVPVEIDYHDAIDRPIDDLRIAFSPELEYFDVEMEVDAVVRDALGAFEAAGASVEEVSIEYGFTHEELLDTLETLYPIFAEGPAVTIEQSFGIDLRAHPDRISDTLVELLDRAEGGETADLAATGVPRTQLFDAYHSVLAAHDVLVTPVVGSEAVDLRLKTDELFDWFAEQVLTWPFNATGHPVASVPAGLTDDGYPVGMQIVGRHYEDDTVLAVSAAIERERPWHDNYRAPDGRRGARTNNRDA